MRPVRAALSLLLTLVLAAFAFVMVGASPASADGNFATPRACVAYDGTGPDFLRRKETCAVVRWSNQVDGTGVALEYLNVTTIDGCNHISGNAYQEPGYWAAWPGTNFWSSYIWADTGNCNWSKDHEIRGPDVGGIEYHLSMCQGDDYLWWDFVLLRNDYSRLDSKGHDDTSAHCPA